MQLPQFVENMIRRFNQNGLECYAVGGCVRDSLLGFSPTDWDLCTNATPQTVMNLFADVPCIPTGLQHGTVTLLIEGKPLEITTYRTETGYTDSRHPDEVHFVSSLREDLARRDFTANAMAYHPDEGVIDPFDGKRDIEANVLRCVGIPTERFREDALRILRGLRFASCLGFALETETARALVGEKQGLLHVAAERIREELNRLLLGKNAAAVLTEFSSVIGMIIPELEETVGFAQHNPYHDKDVYGHTVAAVANAVPKLTVRLTLLLHDIGKPRTFSLDENECGHFYSHANVSEELATQVLARLRYDRQTTQRVLTLIRYHDVVLNDTASCVKRWLNRLGEACFRELLLVKEGDCRAQAEAIVAPRLADLSDISLRLQQVLEEEQCFSLKDLAVNGNDLLVFGIPAGKQIGELLAWLLEQVIDGKLPNERESLLNAIRKNT